jgi:hypothetical protein
MSDDYRVRSSSYSEMNDFLSEVGWPEASNHEGEDPPSPCGIHVYHDGRDVCHVCPLLLAIERDLPRTDVRILSVETRERMAAAGRQNRGRAVAGAPKNRRIRC